MRITFVGTEGGFSRILKRGMSARGNSLLKGSIKELCRRRINTYFSKAIKLCSNGLDALSNANGIMENRVFGVYGIRGLVRREV